MNQTRNNFAIAVRFLRSRKRARPVSLDLTGADDGETYHRNLPDERHAPPEASTDEQELSQKVSQAVEQLPENQKIAIILNKFESKSYDEISEILDCSTMAVKSLLSRARANLRDSLSRYVKF